ncbi:MAG: M4 family metallopeptidase [Saprospiraceae bacterium]|nr:M4 family metallopeptidase [Saprospiraceae bacterium]
MKRSIRTILFAALLLTFSQGFAQIKPIQKATGLALPADQLEPILNPHTAPLAAPSPWSVPLPHPAIDLNPPVSTALRIQARDERGLPIWVECAFSNLDGLQPAEQAQRFFMRLAVDMRISDPDKEWVLMDSRLDDKNTGFLSFYQTYQGIPVDGSECRLHFRLGRLHLFAGRYVPTPQDVKTAALVTLDGALQTARTEVNARPITVSSSFLPEIQPPILVIYGDEDVQPQVCWKVELMADAMHRWTVYVQAQSNVVIHKRQETCSLHAEHIDMPPPVMDGPFTASAIDLKGVSRLIHTYQVGSTFYMLDGSQPMFKLAPSQLPDEPVGGILTVDAKNTSPALGSFQASHIVSGNNSWNHPAGVSAHYNAGIAYAYYRQTFNRNSINGSGGTILSFVNVADDDGGPMDNAFWNGEAMFYGNGDQAFLPLARSLDVAGHEMTHGVIQATANLVYEKEPGALNESLADIFATMIDRDDWRIGEEVVKTNVFPSGALRDLQDPHNGGSGLGSPGWQPKHTNEKYNGTQDNGGVHINSGITNHAFYLFASNAGVTKEQAEQVFYLALNKYLVKSSKFLDFRYAVLQSCKDLFGDATPLVTIAENAFNAVGIGSGNSGGGTPGDYQDDIPSNPGDDFLLFSDAMLSKVFISLPDGSSIQTLSATPPRSKPSVTDDGSLIVFVGADKKMHLISIDWSTGTPTESIIQNQPIWANVAIAKDGSRIAAIPDDAIPVIQVFDFGLNSWTDFNLYNPTFSEGVVTNEVRYADALEFDHSGAYIVYDAYNLVSYSDGSILDYWDIGFLEVWNLTTNNFAVGNIFKLFTSIPEFSSVANPTFAKNSEYILAFDFYDGQSQNFYVMGANLETGDVGQIYQNTVLGYPNYSVQDDQLLFDAETDFFLDPVLARIDLNADKISGVASSEVVVIDGGARGVWFANGKRTLTAINEPTSDSQIHIYPNPGMEGFSATGIPDQATLRIYNSTGQLVREVDHWSTGAYIDMSAINAGIYWLEIIDGHSYGRATWVKIK